MSWRLSEDISESLSPGRFLKILWKKFLFHVRAHTWRYRDKNFASEPWLLYPHSKKISYFWRASSLVPTFVAGRNEYVLSSLRELGTSQLRSGDTKNAFRSLSKLLATAKRIPDPEGVCNAHMALAFAHKLRAKLDAKHTFEERDKERNSAKKNDENCPRAYPEILNYRTLLEWCRASLSRSLAPRVSSRVGSLERFVLAGVGRRCERGKAFPFPQEKRGRFRTREMARAGTLLHWRALLE